MTELEQALALVVGRLVHDLKNPLAVILSNLRYLNMTIEGGEDLEAINESLISADRLDRILDDVVDLGRLRAAGAPASSTGPLTDLEAALREKLKIQTGRRTFAVELPELQLRTDHALLRRALLNLLEHAFRNTPSAGTVRLRGARAAGELVLEVLDEGAPFAPEPAPSFLQQELTTRQAAPAGCRSDQGLGLYFAGVAARALGARTELVARDDAPGVIFRLIFPGELLS